MPRRTTKSNAAADADAAATCFTTYSPALPRIARAMARIGGEPAHIAEAFGVTVETLKEWHAQHPELATAMDEGAKDAIASVEQALFKRATGYSQVEDKVSVYRGETLTVPTTKHYPPDVAAAKIILTNLASNRWRDKQEINHVVTEELAEVMKRIRGGV